jgi:hypothetical protein
MPAVGEERKRAAAPRDLTLYSIARRKEMAGAALAHGEDIATNSQSRMI